MKPKSLRPLLLTAALVGCGTAMAQTPPPTDNPSNTPTEATNPATDSLPPADPMTPATQPNPTDDPSQAAPTVAPDPAIDSSAPGVAPDPVPVTTSPMPEDAMAKDHVDGDRGFPWGLLGLLGLLGLIPRKPKIDTYAVRDSTGRTTATGYDNTRAP